jgi:hypothetical protein
VLDQQWELATACFDLGAVMIVFAYWYSIKISGASRAIVCAAPAHPRQQT